jgi:hypothetical protein
VLNGKSSSHRDLVIGRKAQIQKYSGSSSCTVSTRSLLRNTPASISQKLRITNLTLNFKEEKTQRSVS